MATSPTLEFDLFYRQRHLALFFGELLLFIGVWCIVAFLSRYRFCFQPVCSLLDTIARYAHEAVQRVKPDVKRGDQMDIRALC